MTAIRPVRPDEFDRLLTIINEAAAAYRGTIPDDCWHEPYMSKAQLRDEMAAGVSFSGIEIAGELVAVMGIQDLGAVHLVRHAYVDPDHQGEGLGGQLIVKICAGLPHQILVGTWSAAQWAIRFYEKHGFALVPDKSTPGLLQTYWNIPPRQAAESVVLARPPIADTR